MTRARYGRMRAFFARPTRVLLAAAALCACSAESEKPAGAAAGRAAAGNPGRGGIAVTCQSDEGIDEQTRSELTTTARRLRDELKKGQLDALWHELHPQARREDQKKAFTDALSAMQQRLSATGENPKIERIHRVDLSGGINNLARVTCGTEGDDDTTLMVNAGDEDVAVVMLLDEAGGSEVATTVQVRRRGDKWRLLGIQVNPSEYRGARAATYERMADNFMRQQKVVTAYLLLGLAQTLSDRGAAVKSGLHDRIEQKLAAISRDQLFAAETGTWTIGQARFQIQGLSLVATQQDISPVIKYVSPQGLVQDLLDRDADLLVEEVRRRFPELPKHFDTVVFEAYADVPNQPGASYQAYRVVRYFDPAKRRG